MCVYLPVRFPFIAEVGFDHGHPLRWPRALWPMGELFPRARTNGVAVPDEHTAPQSAVFALHARPFQCSLPRPSVSISQYTRGKVSSLAQPSPTCVAQTNVPHTRIIIWTHHDGTIINYFRLLSLNTTSALVLLCTFQTRKHATIHNTSDNPDTAAIRTHNRAWEPLDDVKWAWSGLQRQPLKPAHR
jgi:hypothetical protein